MLFKINSLLRGYSGVRFELIEALMILLNAGVYPCIPAKGSVGASGDLAPLAHMSIVLLGEGEARHNGKIIPALEALKKAGLTPLRLEAKEGLALLNGTQVSTALAVYHLMQTEILFSASLMIGALSVEALMASTKPFTPCIHEVRGQKGQIDVARYLRELLAGSEIQSAHQSCGRIQDPYSFRCQPQILGACLDNLRHAKNILMIEANGVTDNPLVFPDEDLIVSGGNFHAEPVALIADLMATIVAEMGSVSERRLSILVDPKMNNNLPAFLVPEPGLNSGFMLAQVTAAALVSANKSLAHPFSVDTIPTSANQEDHVSMATYGAYRLGEMIENMQTVLGIELLAACQGVDFRKPNKTSKKLQLCYEKLRSVVEFYGEDRYFAPDIEKAKQVVKTFLDLSGLME